ncbi:MAG: TetR/AcrR family transcriptional regulator [Actinobacteria bacterium]|nr:TetR/AcrR family transcriptional regulator [Actinomycetota bacterium]
MAAASTSTSAGRSSTDTPTTRERLLEAGERLFADRGIDAVSLAELTQAAGLHNTGAVHYHFGGREQLLDAVVQVHRDALDRRRAELLDEAERSGRIEPAALVRCLVAPMAELLDDERGRRFLSIQAQRALRPVERRAGPRPLVQRIWRLTGRADDGAPLAEMRFELGLLLALSALAQRARTEAEHGREAGIGRDAFVAELLAAITRMTAVPTEEPTP